jgi:hypothetical protein
MLAPRYRVLRWIGPLIGLGPLLIVAIQPEPQPKPWEYVASGLVYGTFFGHATLAAAVGVALTAFSGLAGGIDCRTRG